VIETAAQVCRRPAGRVTEAFSDGAARQGAYGLLESDAVTPDAVASGMFVACARRCERERFVYCAVDGTSLTLTDRRREKDFGPIGTRAEGARGLKVINALILSPDGVPLGLGAQRWWTRPLKPRRKHRDQLPPEKKETGHWLEAMRGVRAVMGTHAPDTPVWFQLDREGDAWPMLSEAGLAGQWFTVRAARNRRVRLPNGGRGKLRPLLAKQAVVDTYGLDVPANPHRRGRTAHLEIRACLVTLDVRDKRTSRRSPLTLNVVQARERGTTPPGEKPIEWTLLTNHPIVTVEDLHSVIVGYSMRWRIEEFHRTWKSGACRVEETQLHTAGAVIKWATILAAVAIRIERLKQLSREQPERPATDEFTPLEIQAITALRFGKTAKQRVPAGVVPTIEQVTLWVAQIGGYTGRSSSGGPPGSTTLARGLQDVAAAVKALDGLGLSD
jgi:transposase Tn5 family protein